MTAVRGSQPVPARPLRGAVKRNADERRWAGLLRPMSEAYAELTVGIEEFVAGLPDDVLADLSAAAGWPTATNCWWADFRVAPLVRDAASREQWLRSRQRGAAKPR